MSETCSAIEDVWIAVGLPQKVPRTKAELRAVADQLQEVASRSSVAKEIALTDFIAANKGMFVQSAPLDPSMQMMWLDLAKAVQTGCGD